MHTPKVPVDPDPLVEADTALPVFQLKVEKGDSTSVEAVLSTTARRKSLTAGELMMGKPNSMVGHRFSTRIARCAEIIILNS